MKLHASEHNHDSKAKKKSMVLLCCGKGGQITEANVIVWLAAGMFAIILQANITFQLEIADFIIYV